MRRADAAMKPIDWELRR